jgi:gamma-glutamyltranspeptidase/glutathione hydrolase
VSVFDDFGSGVFVPELGIVLNNRAAGFTDGENAAAPGSRPVHTLAPALIEADGSRLALATPGADGQVQTLLQVLASLRRGASLEEAVAAPRWRSEAAQLLIERGHPQIVALRARGHDVLVLDPGSDVFGAVVAAGAPAHRPGSTSSGGVGVPYAVADWRRASVAGAIR